MFKVENSLKLTTEDKENITVDVHFDKEKKALYTVAEHKLNDTGPQGVYLYAILKFDFNSHTQDIQDFILNKPIKEFWDSKELAEAVAESTNMFKRMRADLREIAYQETILTLAEAAQNM